MSYNALVTVRNNLISSSSVSSQVSASNISVGWPRQLDSFPSILLSQSSGDDVGLLGYRTGGLRHEGVNMQIDIYSRESRLEVLNIADSIVPVMISTMSARKTDDTDNFDDEMNVYRKTQV